MWHGIASGAIYEVTKFYYFHMVWDHHSPPFRWPYEIHMVYAMCNFIKVSNVLDFLYLVLIDVYFNMRPRFVEFHYFRIISHLKFVYSSLPQGITWFSIYSKSWLVSVATFNFYMFIYLYYMFSLWFYFVQSS